LYTIIFFSSFPFLIILQYRISSPIQNKAIEMSVEKANYNAIINDSLQNLTVIIAYSLENIIEQHFAKAYNLYFIALKKYLLSLLKLVICGVITTMIPTLFINTISAVSVIRDEISISEFIAFTTIASINGHWLVMLSQRLRNIRISSASALRFNENINGQHEDIDTGLNIENNIDTVVSFNNVSFSYNENNVYAINNNTFKINKGEHVAFVGGSGSGKSTILKLISGLYTCNNGIININGNDIKKISKKILREYISYVPQECFLFPGTIKDNITCNNLENDSSIKLIKACEDAGILEFINNLPKKFNTIVTESADNISGGQRQRIAIARALYKNSPLLILDEATSALDPITEAIFFKAFDILMKGKTVIMVAHRFSAINKCDKIIVMDNGSISDINNHDNLLNNNKIYTSLYEAQHNTECEV